MSILISGGAGFVGRHLVRALLTENPAADIWIVDDFSTGRPPSQWELYDCVKVEQDSWCARYRFAAETHQPFTLIQANFASVLGGELGYFPRTVVPSLPVFDEVYHLASIVGGRRMIEEKPLLVGMDLAIDSLFFLWAVSLNKAKRVLYASSSAAYPVNRQKTDTFEYLTEDMIDFENGVLSPDLTYGWSKLTGEYLARLAVEKHKLSVGIVRPFSGYGEDQDLSYPVPAIALRAAAHQSPIRVWGSGQQGRDFVHIDDCIDGLIRTCRRISDASAVNLGSGVLTTFVELAALIVRLAGYQADVTGTDNRPVGVSKRVSGSERAQTLLGWRPSISLEEGMVRVVRHAETRLKHGAQPET
jgi:UDP-glucose 4-epimerase